jgi:hypothetical protein
LHRWCCFNLDDTCDSLKSWASFLLRNWGSSRCSAEPQLYYSNLHKLSWIEPSPFEVNEKGKTYSHCEQSTQVSWPFHNMCSLYVFFCRGISLEFTCLQRYPDELPKINPRTVGCQFRGASRSDFPQQWAVLWHQLSKVSMRKCSPIQKKQKIIQAI